MPDDYMLSFIVYLVFNYIMPIHLKCFFMYKKLVLLYKKLIYHPYLRNTIYQNFQYIFKRVCLTKKTKINKH